MLFDDMLNAEDFALATNDLACAVRTKHGLPSLSQLGLVVESVEETASKLESRGIGPILILDGPAKLWRKGGKGHNFRGKMGLAYYRGVELELLEPGEGSDFYRQSLNPSGGITIQHLGFAVKDVEAWANRLAAKDISMFIRGKLKTGPLTVDFVYLDTMAEAGFMIEFLSWRIFRIPFRLPAVIERGIGQLEKWSGNRSIAA